MLASDSLAPFIFSSATPEAIFEFALSDLTLCSLPLRASASRSLFSSQNLKASEDELYGADLLLVSKRAFIGGVGVEDAGDTINLGILKFFFFFFFV